MATRVTQTSRMVVYDPTAVTNGGTARVTQVTRVVIRTAYPVGGGLMLKGVGM